MNAPTAGTHDHECAYSGCFPWVPCEERLRVEEDGHMRCAVYWSDIICAEHRAEEESNNAA